MGTSQSFKLKSNPNWTSAKKALTKIATGQGDNDVNCQRLMSNFRWALGDSLYVGGGGRQGKYSFGRSGGVAIKGFLKLASNTRQNGLMYSLGIRPDDIISQPLTKRDIIERILLRVCPESDADFDDDAAIIAMKRMLVVIFNDCEDPGAIEDLINSATETDMTRWIIEYEVAYILEYSIQVFKSHIFEKSENPNGVRSEIERWLRREIEEKMRDKISQIELNSPEGIEEIETLTAEILVIWGQE